MTLDPDPETVVEVLARRVSRINARVICERGKRVLSDPTRVRPDEWPLFVSSMRGAARLFLSQHELDQAFDEVARLAGPDRPTAPLPAREIAIAGEPDVHLARQAARELCSALGAPVFVIQRVTTSVSELARNIASYTPGGRVVLEPLTGEPPRLRVVADDRGPGIPHLADVLGGRYRSRTGLGRGLRGVKQLMEVFDVKTGPQGTRVTVEARLR